MSKHQSKQGILEQIPKSRLSVSPTQRFSIKLATDSTEVNIENIYLEIATLG